MSGRRFKRSGRFEIEPSRPIPETSTSLAFPWGPGTIDLRSKGTCNAGDLYCYGIPEALCNRSQQA